MTKQFERNEVGDAVNHYTRVLKDDGTQDIYVDSMPKSQEEKYLKEQVEKGYRPEGMDGK